MELTGKGSKAIANYIKDSYLMVKGDGVVVGRDGEVVLSIEEVKKKMQEDPELKQFIVASNATGGGSLG